MYQVVDNIVVISVNDWCKAGLTYKMFQNDSSRGYLSIVSRAWHGETLIDVASIKKQERRRILEAVYGKIDTDKEVEKSIFRPELDIEARTFFTSWSKPDGSPLDVDKVKEYVNRATLFNAVKKGLDIQISTRARCGKKVNKGDFWKLATVWFSEQAIGRIEGNRKIEPTFPCPAFTNWRSFERAFKLYLNESYISLIDGRNGNDNARKVSVSAEKLLLALWRTNDKPFINRVHELYLEFVSGNKELFDKETGEVFRPEDFRYKEGRALEISMGTVWGYLKDVVNTTSVYSDRNGNFAYNDLMRPKKHRSHGRYSLSKVSMDDVAMSRKSVRGWIYKYIAVDVVSGYYFRPAYIVGKPTHDTVLESFRNMFCELVELGLPMPGELEVEYHLMQDIAWLSKMFPFVRFCESPTEKRAEHKIKSLKYGVAKKQGHTRGRWYAKHEAYRSVRNKVAGDFIEPTYQPQNIVADDLADIEKYNNELHPLQKTYPGMTRKEVLIANFNPNLQPIDKRTLYRYIGNETPTGIRQNDYLQCANETFEIVDFDCLRRLKPNNTSVDAYWLPEENGSIDRIYLYQDDTYIGEAINRSQYDYNECAIERTDEDKANMLHQNKRVATFDKFIKDQRFDIPKVGSLEASTTEILNNLPDEIIEPKIEIQHEFNIDDSRFGSWGEIAITSL